MKFICPELQKRPLLKWGKIDCAFKSGVSADCSEEGASGVCSEAGDCSFCAQDKTFQHRTVARHTAVRQFELRHVKTWATNLGRKQGITKL